MHNYFSKLWGISFYITSLLLFLLGCWAFPVHGQVYNFQKYSVKEGLPYSNVYSFTQDKEGYLWIGTGEGLSRFDGQDFTTYTTSQGLAENSITAITKTKSGNIWLGHLEGGISFYDADSDTFTTVLDTALNNFVNDIYKDEKGRIWIATVGGGVYVYEGDNSVRSIQLSEDKGIINIFSITEDYKNNLWIGTNKGVYVKKEENYNKLNGLPGQKIRFVYEDSHQNIWIGNYQVGLIYIPKKTLTAYPLSKLPVSAKTFTPQNSKLGNKSVYCITEGKQGHLWLGTLGGGISKFTVTNRTPLKGYFQPFSKKNGLSSNKIWTLDVDNEGNIWVGTIGGGATKIPFNYDRFQLYNKKTGLNSDLVWALTQSSRHYYWIGTNAGFTKANYGAPVQRLSRFHNSADIDYKYNTIGVYRSSDNKIWVGTGESKFGSYTLNRDSGLSPQQLRCITIKGEQAGVYRYYDVIQQQGKVWLAFNRGIMEYDPSTGRNKKHIYNVEMYCAYEDDPGDLWFGSKGKGVIKYNGNSFIKYDDTLGLQHSIIHSIKGDEQGNLWLGTKGGGIYKFDGRKFKQYSFPQQHSSKSAFSIVVGSNNKVWAGTSTGIIRFDPTTKKFRHYGESEGFLGVENNTDAAFRDKAGNLWFGTVNGAVKYDPSADRKNTTPPIIHITGLEIFYEEVPFPKDHKMSYQDKQITFEYAAICFTNPQEVRYQYKLEGFNEQWSPVTKKTSVEYSNLPPGDYTFKVKACNNDKLWNKTPATYRFTVTPPFWMTWWFYASCALFVGLVVYGFIRWRTYRIRRERNILENKVQERTKELQQQKEKVEEANKTLADQKQIIEQKNKDITDSIRYAQRIQRAILPEIKMIKSAFPQSFVLYKPCDIVSGDFYFFEQVNNKSIIAAVDCTGHGVPGALMSMIGNNALAQIINERNVTDPAHILNSLDEEVATTLQKETDLEVNDGMDMVLCTIDEKDRKLKASGALRPLYLIREGELIEYKGNRFAIGGHSLGMDKDFQEDEITVQKGDVIYIFSDGYPDQFGGPKGKKFMVKRFKRLLVDIADKTMAEQHRILDETIQDWMEANEEEQIDNIMVIGIKF